MPDPVPVQIPEFNLNNNVKRGDKEITLTIPVEGGGGGGTETLRFDTSKGGVNFGSIGKGAMRVGLPGVPLPGGVEVDPNSIKNDTIKGKIDQLGQGKEKMPTDTKAALELIEKLAALPNAKIYFKTGAGTTELVIASGANVVATVSGVPVEFGRTALDEKGDKPNGKALIEHRDEKLLEVAKKIPLGGQAAPAAAPAATPAAVPQPSNMPAVANGIYNKADSSPYTFTKDGFMNAIKQAYPEDKMTSVELKAIDGSVDGLEKAIKTLSASNKVTRSVNGSVTTFETVNGKIELDLDKIFKSNPAAAKAAIDAAVKSINDLGSKGAI